MLTRIQKWGNSQGLRPPKGVLHDAKVSVGDEVDLVARDGVIVIAPAHPTRGRHRLEDLVRQIPADYQVEEVDWGLAEGKEGW